MQRMLHRYGAMQNNDVSIMVQCKRMLHSYGAMQNNDVQLWFNAKECCTVIVQCKRIRF